VILKVVEEEVDREVIENLIETEVIKKTSFCDTF
jgi:hypothetical protein